MKKAIIAIAIFLLSLFPAQAQYYELYFPLILKEPDTMPDMTIGLIKPRLDYNYILNPSAETTDNFTAVGGATVTRVTTYQKYGRHSYSVVTPSSGDGLQLTASALTNAPHFFVARIRFMTQISLQFRLNSTTKSAQLLEKIDGDWYLYGAYFSAAEASGGTSARILRVGAAKPGTNGFYVDGAHAGPIPDTVGGYSTYVDGTQEGCAWLGTPHASVSYRSADSLAGGVVTDFFQGYKFFLRRVMGAGVVTPEITVDNFSMLPGGELNSEKIPPRNFTLVGDFYGNDEADLHAIQQSLELALDASAYPAAQQIRLRFYKSAVQKEITAVYSGGLEGDLPIYYNDYEPGDAQWTKLYKFIMPASIQFTASDPFFYEVGEHAATLDTVDTATFRTIAGRLTSTKQWSAMGPPGAGGTYGTVFAMVEDDQYIYIGGDFQNWDGIANADYIVRRNKQTGTYSAMGSGLNGPVYALAKAPNGDIIVGGEFANAGGFADADCIAGWDGSAFYAMGAPAVAAFIVYALFYDPDGLLWIGGSFTNWAGIGAADYIVTWDGSSYDAPLTPANGIVRAFAHDGVLLYIGGEFTAFGIVPVTGIASWDGSAYAAVGDSLGVVVVNTIAIWRNEVVIGTDVSPYAHILKGDVWQPLGGVGTDGTVYRLHPAPDNTLLMTGEFTLAGAYGVDSVARFNGNVFQHFDIDLPGANSAQVILTGNSDPVVSSNYDILLGMAASGTGSYAGLSTIINEGTIAAFPKIVYNRSGGTGATLRTLRNERTGSNILFNYNLLDGETLVIDLYPKSRTITSTTFNNRLDAYLPGSNFSQWQLLPGSQGITTLVVESGSPTVTAYMLWRNAYKSWN